MAEQVTDIRYVAPNCIATRIACSVDQMPQKVRTHRHDILSQNTATIVAHLVLHRKVESSILRRSRRG
eukprot:9327115-Pyramimonas_sp.AAC.1